MTARQDFVAGVKSVAPVLLGLAPFGLISGVAAVDIGLTPLQTMGMSVLIFAGTAQLAAIDLLGENAAVSVVLLTVLVVNARLVMYSASIAPYLTDMSRRWRSLLSYLLTDHVYALAVTTFDDESRTDSTRWYVLGLGVAMWTVWQVCTLLGIMLGTTIPDSSGLTFVVPLTFLAILVPELKDRWRAGIGVLSGSTAVVASGLPMNLGLLTAAVVGVLLGAVVEEVRR